jgi:hypothetical protein
MYGMYKRSDVTLKKKMFVILKLEYWICIQLSISEF